MRNSLRLTCVLLVTILCLAPVAALAQAAAPATEAPATTMASGILIDLQSQKVLWAKDAQTKRSPASLTKILTALTVLETANLQDTAAISKAARNVPGGRTYAEEGWTFTVQDLLWGLLLQSGNDAAITLAEKVSPDGTVAGFMKLANARAVELGATDSNFMNPHGLDEPGHTTTARDLAIITAAAMQNPIFAQMVASKTRNVPWGDGSQRTFINHNKMLWRTPGAIGVKTGFTNEAGNSLVSAVRRNGSTLVAVVMGTPRHYEESNALYDWGFANLETLKSRSTSDVSMPAIELTAANADRLVVTESSSSIGMGKLLLPLLAIAVLCTLAIAFRQRILYGTGT